MIVVWITLIIVVVLTSITVIQGFRLMRRYYVQPYSLAVASRKQKIRWAFHMILWEFPFWIGIVFLFSLTAPALGDKLGLMLICGGLWLIAVPIMVLLKMRDMNHFLKGYKKWDVQIRSNQPEGKGHEFFKNIILKLMKTEEMERFVAYGYLDETAT